MYNAENEYRCRNLSIDIVEAMTSFYSSSQTNWSSSPKNDNVYGTRSIVEIKNGKGFRVNEALNKSGEVLERKKKTLNTNEIKQIMSGVVVPKVLPGGSNAMRGRKVTRRKVTRPMATRKQPRN